MSTRIIKRGWYFCRGSALIHYTLSGAPLCGRALSAVRPIRIIFGRRSDVAPRCATCAELHTELWCGIPHRGQPARGL